MKTKIIVRTLQFSFCSFLCFSALVLPQKMIRNIKIPPSQKQILFNPSWEAQEHETIDVKKIETILRQPFTYLGKGNQTIVFESQDKQYVLKLFRYRFPKFFLTQKIKQFISTKFLHRSNRDDFQTKINKTFTACKIAFDRCKEETGVVYIHCNLTPLANFSTSLTTPNGQYNVFLRKQRFLLQKKAIPFKEALLNAKNDENKLQEMIESFFQLIQSRLSKGVTNHDRNLQQNFGFIGSQAIEIDFGNYRSESYELLDSSAEYQSFSQSFHRWIRKNIPSYENLFLNIQNNSHNSKTASKA